MFFCLYMYPPFSYNIVDPPPSRFKASLHPNDFIFLGKSITLILSVMKINNVSMEYLPITVLGRIAIVKLFLDIDCSLLFFNSNGIPETIYLDQIAGIPCPS